MALTGQSYCYPHARLEATQESKGAPAIFVTHLEPDLKSPLDTVSPIQSSDAVQQPPARQEQVPNTAAFWPSPEAGISIPGWVRVPLAPHSTPVPRSGAAGTGCSLLPQTNDGVERKLNIYFFKKI